MKHLVSSILALGPWDFKLGLELQTWNYDKIGMNLVNESTTKNLHEKLGQTIALTGQNIALTVPKLKMFRLFMFFFPSGSLKFHVFCEFKPCLNYLSPCPRIIFECKVIVCGWKRVRFNQLSANWTAALCFWHWWFAGRLHDIVGQFLLGFLKYAPLVYAIQHMKLMSIPLNQHAKCIGLFFLLGPKILVQAEYSSWIHAYIQTIIMAWGFRRYISCVYNHICVCFYMFLQYYITTSLLTYVYIYMYIYI